MSSSHSSIEEASNLASKGPLRSINSAVALDAHKKKDGDTQEIEIKSRLSHSVKKSHFYSSLYLNDLTYTSTLNKRGRIRKRRSNSAPNRPLLDFADTSKSEEVMKSYAGRPLYESHHLEFRKSLLSIGSKHLNLSGFVNLVFVVLVSMNFRLVINNFRKYGKSKMNNGIGLLMEVPKGFSQMYSDWPLLRCTLKTHVAILFAWAIERFIGPRSIKPLTIPMLMLQALNICIVLFYPYLTVNTYKTEPSLSALMLTTSVIWALKLFSFHHVCYDFRKAVCDGDDLMEVCRSKKEAKAASKYPKCIKLTDLYRFIIMPTVCFQFHYPKTDRIRWMKVLKQFIQFAFFLAVCKILAEQYIVVAVTNTFTMEEFKSANYSTVLCHIVDRMLLLSVPVLYCWLLMFVVIFHFWCNLLAEITRFGDRRFYGDWWNASCFGEYWRKWNLPIHQFIIRHISKPLHNVGLPKSMVHVIVFIISAALHEYLISVPLGLGWTGYVFMAMLGQIPLLFITELDMIKNNKTLGNVLFWCLFCFAGQPLGVLLYWYLWGVKHGSFS